MQIQKANTNINLQGQDKRALTLKLSVLNERQHETASSLLGLSCGNETQISAFCVYLGSTESLPNGAPVNTYVSLVDLCLVVVPSV